MLQNLPNVITLIRIVLAPVIAIILWQPQTAYLGAIALALFCFAGFSDWLDGWLAGADYLHAPRSVHVADWMTASFTNSADKQTFQFHDIGDRVLWGKGRGRGERHSARGTRH